MEPKATLSLTEVQLSVLLDAIHSEFMSASEDATFRGLERAELLDTLSNLHARVQLAIEELESGREGDKVGVAPPRTDHPSWLDLALCWLTSHVHSPAVVVYPRDEDPCWALLRSWGVDVADALNGEFVVIPFESADAAAEACHSVPKLVAYAMAWSGSSVTTENL